MDGFDNPLVMTEGGHFISDKWLRLSEILQDVDPSIELRWIEPRARTSDASKPYAICHVPPGRPAYVIMFADETDDPVALLARLWEGKNPDYMETLEARERAEKAFELKKTIEEQEELADQFHFLATNRSPYFAKHKTASGEIVKLDTQTGHRL